MKEMKKKRKVSKEFIKHTAAFSFELFQKIVKQNESVMISPVSVLLAMTMAANGADNDTRKEMEQVLGGSSVQELNSELNNFLESLYTGEKAVLKRADSIWFKNIDRAFSINNAANASADCINKDFLKLISDEFRAELFPAPFNSQTKEQINQWVLENTEGRIENFLKVLLKDALIYLIDIWTLDAEWARIYEEHEISKGVFTAYNNKKQKAFMMKGTEISYLKDETATGFVKPYAQGYSFVALLPKEGIDIMNYVKSLSGEKFLYLLDNVKHTMVLTEIPKFQGKASLELGEKLQEMGIKKAFSNEADFSLLRKSKEPICITKVFQDTYIQVDERGTKAGAATAVELARGAVMADKVKLDHPFVYAIVDNQTKLPLFLGTVLSV